MLNISPQLCVGFLFLILYPGPPPPPPPPPAPPPSNHTIFHTSSLPTIFVNHHLSHTIFHTHLCQQQSFTHHLLHTPSLTHHLSPLSTTIFHTPSFTHTHLSHIIFANHLCQPPSFTHHLSHTPSFTHTISHTPSFTHHLLHTIFYTHTHPLSQTILLATCTSTLRGRRDTYGTGLALVARLGPFWSPVTPWHLRRRRSTWRHPRSFHVACVALGGIYLHFAWQAWHLWHWAGSGGVLGPVLVAGDAAALCEAGVALGDIHLSRGKRGTWRHPPPLCVAGVALMALGWLWWRAWTRFGRR